MALILGKVVDVLVTACGFFVVEIAPTCQLSGSRLLGDPSIDSILFVMRPIHGIRADCIQSCMLPGPEQEAVRIVTSLLRCAGHWGIPPSFALRCSMRFPAIDLRSFDLFESSCLWAFRTYWRLGPFCLPNLLTEKDFRLSFSAPYSRKPPKVPQFATSLTYLRKMDDNKKSLHHCTSAIRNRT